MSVDARINRIILGLVIGVLIVILITALGVTLLVRGGFKERPRIDQRSPIETLSYCGTQQGRLCVNSFSQSDDGLMLVNFSTPNPYYPEFILNISFNGDEYKYECERDEAPQTGMTCSGIMQVPGTVMDFQVISKNRGTLLAEGRFAIIGIALAAPEDVPTATMEGLSNIPVTPTVTPMFITILPTPSSTIPILPSYPNPSYPNPSYPNPSYP